MCRLVTIVYNKIPLLIFLFANKHSQSKIIFYLSKHFISSFYSNNNHRGQSSLNSDYRSLVTTMKLKVAAVFLLIQEVFCYNYTTKYIDVPLDHFRYVYLI